MIVHAVEKLVEAGLDDILVVSGANSLGDLIKLLESGKNFNCKLTR